MKSAITTAILTLATLASLSANAASKCAVQVKDQDGVYKGGSLVDLKVGEPTILQQEGDSIVSANLTATSLNLVAYNIATKEIKAMSAASADSKYLAMLLPDSNKMVVCFDLKN